jgi:hypothetical protein
MNLRVAHSESEWRALAFISESPDLADAFFMETGESIGVACELCDQHLCRNSHGELCDQHLCRNSQHLCRNSHGDGRFSYMLMEICDFWLELMHDNDGLRSRLGKHAGCWIFVQKLVTILSGGNRTFVEPGSFARLKVR